LADEVQVAVLGEALVVPDGQLLAEGVGYVGGQDFQLLGGLSVLLTMRKSVE